MSSSTAAALLRRLLTRLFQDATNPRGRPGVLCDLFATLSLVAMGVRPDVRAWQ